MVEDKLAELELQHRGLQELIATLKDGHGAQKVAKWQAKMESVSLENMRHKREIEKLRDEVLLFSQIVFLKLLFKPSLYSFYVSFGNASWT
jgi:cell division protein FtsB